MVYIYQARRFKMLGIWVSNEYQWLRCVEVTVWLWWTLTSTTTRPLTTRFNANLTVSSSSFTTQVRHRDQTRRCFCFIPLFLIYVITH